MAVRKAQAKHHSEPQRDRKGYRKAYTSVAGYEVVAVQEIGPGTRCIRDAFAQPDSASGARTTQ